MNVLRLSNNNIAGVIPTELGSINELQILSLDYMLLDSTIPTEFGALINLEELHLHKNHFDEDPYFSQGITGTIPAQIFNLGKLLVLQLAGNQMTGVIPAGIENLTNLKVLRPSRNNFSGVIPVEVGSMLSLTTLNVFDNNLTGMSSEICTSRYWESLRVGCNEDTGVAILECTCCTDVCE